MCIENHLSNLLTLWLQSDDYAVRKYCFFNIIIIIRLSAHYMAVPFSWIPHLPVSCAVPSLVVCCFFPSNLVASSLDRTSEKPLCGITQELSDNVFRSEIRFQIRVVGADITTAQSM